ncbi:MAG: invasion associated locus B family protein [Candidatus Phaeomarinobacter sp.]
MIRQATHMMRQSMVLAALAGGALAAGVGSAFAQTATQTQYGGWLLACYEPGADEDRAKSCILSHRVSVESGARLLEVRFGFDPETEAYPAQFVTPLSTSLKRGLALVPKGQTGSRLPFTRCDAGGCYVERPFDLAATEVLAAAPFAVTIADKAGTPIRVEVDSEGLAEGLASLRSETLGVFARLWRFTRRLFPDQDAEGDDSPPLATSQEADTSAVIDLTDEEAE